MTVAATDLTPLLCPTCQHGDIAWMKVGERTLLTCGECGATECALAWAMAAWDRQRKERARWKSANEPQQGSASHPGTSGTPPGIGAANERGV